MLLAASWTPWIIAAAAAIVIPWLLFTEFSYFGAGSIRRVYNGMSRNYNKKWKRKEYQSKELTSRVFLEPLRKALDDSTEARVLDLACGTGRTTFLLLSEAWFQGRIHALDLSPGMLAKFRASLKKLPTEKSERVSSAEANLIGWTAKEEAAFDAVVMLEASEFIPRPAPLMTEVLRTLKPGGLFLMTKPRGWLAWMYFSRKQRAGQLRALLESTGFQNVRLTPWSPRHDVVYAWKAGVAQDGQQTNQAEAASASA
ncbi:MAG: class I SAM-dependent methyltransferase [Pirellulales bacterium]|nr:class I SAM-dependent methyltransferase [Pirellulales bacterium]